MGALLLPGRLFAVEVVYSEAGDVTGPESVSVEALKDRKKKSETLVQSKADRCFEKRGIQPASPRHSPDALRCRGGEPGELVHGTRRWLL